MSNPLNSPKSDIKQTITRQLQNVASFLAPPPQQPYYSPSSTPLRSDNNNNKKNNNNNNNNDDVSPSSYQGLKNDLAEIGDTFFKKAVTGFSKLASNLLQFDEKDDDFDVVGIDDDVLDFVREVSNRPECWVDFPLSLQHKDFHMSLVQKDHALAIQDLVPNLTTLRHTIHNYMSEQQFWMIYFILLVPRLNEDDYRLLSTPEIVQVRETVLQKLRNKNNIPTVFSADTHGEKGSMVNVSEQSENPFQEIERLGETDYATNRIKNKNGEDGVSFSDLDDETSSGYKQTQSRFSSASEGSDWVRLGGTSIASRSIYRERRSESEGSSSDWHAVEDVDL